MSVNPDINPAGWADPDDEDYGDEVREKNTPTVMPTLFGSMPELADFTGGFRKSTREAMDAKPQPAGVMFKAVAWRAEIDRIEVSHVTDHYVYGTCRGKFGRHKKASLDSRLFYSWDGAKDWLASQAAGRINHLRIQIKAAEYLARAVEALTDPAEES